LSRRPYFFRPYGSSLALALGMGLSTVAACAQNPLVTLPQNYRSVLENNEVQVIHAHYGPHEKVPVHDHPSISTVFVYLNDSGKVRIDHAGGSTFSVVRPPTVTGSFRVVGGMAERHSIENLGDTPSDFLRVELKQVTLDLKEPFRGKAPDSLQESRSAVEFKAPGVQIERVVCVGAMTCPLAPAAEGLVVVAFVPVDILVDGKKDRLKAGAVQWIAAGAAADVESAEGVPAHVLRIGLGGQ
jgi:hypothetical protein